MGSGLFLGIGAAGVAAVLLGAGTVLQALDAREIEPHHGLRLSLLGRLLRRPRWVAGTVIGYLAFPFQLLALGHAPLEAVQPVLTVGLLVLVGAGVFLLSERLRRVELAGVAAMVAGLVVVSWGAPAGPDRPVSAAAFGAAVGVLALMALAPYLVRHRARRLGPLASAALGFACANLAVKGFSDALAAGNWLEVGGYLAAAGLASSVGVLSQMTAFQRYPAVEVAPVTYAIPIFLPGLLGLALLREHWATAPLGGAAFAVGAVVLLIGTATVARSQAVADLSELAHEPPSRAGRRRRP